jgi:ABC-type Fe3+ transport system substrate-binding protein
MTDAINRTSQLVNILRQQLTRSAQGANPTRGAARNTGTGLTDVQVSELIAARVAVIGKDDPQRGRKAFRVFVEAVLSDHFGDAIAHGARFHQLVDDVHREMENSPEIAPLVDHLLLKD